MEYNFQRYLAAKKTVDDRALNRNVWDCLVQTVGKKDHLQVLEIGMGIGAMLQRLVSWGLLTAADYTGLDWNQENIHRAALDVSEWAQRNTYRCQIDGTRGAVQKDKIQVQWQFLVEDIWHFLWKESGCKKWDLLVGQAFLDLVDSRVLLPQMASLLQPGGLAYFSINYDGLTIFEPEDNTKDELILSAYHRTMDERLFNGKPSGDSKTGRRLFPWLRNAGFEILAAGSSDWVVFADEGGYPGDEKYFLYHILSFFEGSLRNRQEIDQNVLTEWLTQRRAQIETQELVYLAHQFDFLARVPP